MGRPGWQLSGRTVLITGAARGIGAESARHLAARGARVALAGLEPEELERVAAQCGPEAAWYECDVTDTSALEQTVDATVKRFGGIDCVIPNAGIGPSGMTRSMDPAAFEATVEVNLLGVWRTVRACLPHVIERRGYVLIISSMSAPLHPPGMAAYAASKAAVEAFGDCIRAELRHLGVDVGVAYFGFIATDLVAGADAHPVFGTSRRDASGPLSNTYPVSDVGKAVADGVEARRRWVLVPRWLWLLIVLRGILQPVVDLAARRVLPDLDRRFEQYVEEHGAEAASALVGRGGEAFRERSANRS